MLKQREKKKSNLQETNKKEKTRTFNCLSFHFYCKRELSSTLISVVGWGGWGLSYSYCFSSSPVLDSPSVHPPCLLFSSPRLTSSHLQLLTAPLFSSSVPVCSSFTCRWSVFPLRRSPPYKNHTTVLTNTITLSSRLHVKSQPGLKSRAKRTGMLIRCEYVYTKKIYKKPSLFFCFFFRRCFFKCACRSFRLYTTLFACFRISSES